MREPPLPLSGVVAKDTGLAASLSFGHYPEFLYRCNAQRD